MVATLGAAPDVHPLRHAAVGSRDRVVGVESPVHGGFLSIDRAVGGRLPGMALLPGDVHHHAR
jgi:hypothetical protein